MAAVPTLREQRVAAGLTQQRLAELAGCSLAMVRLLDRGFRPDQSEVLERIKSVLAGRHGQRADSQGSQIADGTGPHAEAA